MNDVDDGEKLPTPEREVLMWELVGGPTRVVVQWLVGMFPLTPRAEEEVRDG